MCVFVQKSRDIADIDLSCDNAAPAAVKRRLGRAQLFAVDQKEISVSDNSSDPNLSEKERER